MSTNAASNAASDATSDTAEQAQTATQKLKNAAQWLKQAIPKSVNLGIFAGSQAVMSTNFGQYLAAAVLAHTKDEKTKEILTDIIEGVVDLLAALVGAGSASLACSGAAALQFTRSASLLEGLQQVKLFSYGLQFAGQVNQGATEVQLALDKYALGETQALVSMLQGLVSMNSGQLQSDQKSLGSMLRAHAEELETLTADFNKAPAAVAQVLQA